MVSRVLVDGGSSSDILFWDAFRRMGIKEEEIQLIKTSLHAFNGAEVKPLRVIVLPIYAADQIVEVKFLTVNTPSTIKVIMGKEWIHVVQGVVSTLGNEMSISIWSLYHRHQGGSITKPKMLQHRN